MAFKLPFDISDYDHDDFDKWRVITKSGAIYDHADISVDGSFLFMFSEGGNSHVFVAVSEIEAIIALWRAEIH